MKGVLKMKEKNIFKLNGFIGVVIVLFLIAAVAHFVYNFITGGKSILSDHRYCIFSSVASVSYHRIFSYSAKSSKGIYAVWKLFRGH